MDKRLIFIICAAAALNLGTWITILGRFPQSSAAVVLHYTGGVGIDLIGESTQIMLMPLAGLLLGAGNIILGYNLKKILPEATWLLWGITPGIQAILLIAAILIRRLNV